MKQMIAPLSALAMVAGLALSPSAHAADATHPYGHINRHVDAGNNTGDSQVEALNRGQLDQNYYARQGNSVGAAPGYGQPVYGAPAYGQPYMQSPATMPPMSNGYPANPYQ